MAGVGRRDEPWFAMGGEDLAGVGSRQQRQTCGQQAGCDDRRRFGNWLVNMGNDSTHS